MKRILTVLADEQEPFVWAVFITGMPTHRARLARVVGIHLNRHTPRQLGFISNHALEFSKRPLGIGGIGFPLLLTRFLALLPPGSLSNVCEVLQTDEMMGVVGHDAFRDSMIGVLLQPSLVQRPPPNGGWRNECLFPCSKA